MYNLNLFKFPANWQFKRTPLRPKELWVFNFEENYDWDNVWYDAIQVSEDQVVLIGPPLYDTANFLRQNCYFTDHTQKPLEFQINELDRVCVTVVKTTSWIGRLALVDRQQAHYIPVRKQSMEFYNKKVIVTISKNHPISWLKQWIDYHKVVHNLDGLIIYNNQSKIYTSEQLQNELNRDDMIIKIVDYNVPFGCMGGGDWEWQGKKGNFLPWDSDFAQYIMLEHAKCAFLHCAKLAINADTDELLLLKNNTLDELADYCQTSSNSVWLYKGDWIDPIDSRTMISADTIEFEDRKFENYWSTTNSHQRGIGIKWMLAPRRNLEYQWMLHRTSGPHMMTDEILFGHYLAMNTSWSWERDKFTGNQSQLRDHELMKSHLEIWNKRK